VTRRVSREAPRTAPDRAGTAAASWVGTGPSQVRPFLKVDGAGNDFVLLDSRGGAGPRLSRAVVRGLLDRHRGIGGDGLLLLEDGPVPGEPRVLFRNPDGGPASFCGNGARCVALVLLGATRRERVVFSLGRVRVEARRSRPGRVSVLVPHPRSLPVPAGRPPVPLPAGAWLRQGGHPARGTQPAAAGPWYDSGVPHWIVPVPSIDALDLAALARPLRSWKALGPRGTNVDAVEIRGRTVCVRTWERGVEGETLACGSGLVAAGHWASIARGVALPLDLTTAGGDRLRLDADPAGRGLWLEGPARVVFCGTLAGGLPLR
jgi:diaminopimelate epimerase